MQDSSTIREFEFDLLHPDVKVVPITSEITPWIATAKAWKQYTNDYVYNSDKLMRDWLRVMNKNEKWYRNYRMRRYTFSDMFEILMGEPYVQKKHGKWINPLSRVMAYYSTKIQNSYWDSDAKRMRNKTCYTISGQRIKQPAYSLRLRLEEFSDQGIIPNAYNMQLPKDDLKPGQARRTETRRTIEKRQEEWKRRQKH